MRIRLDESPWLEQLGAVPGRKELDCSSESAPKESSFETALFQKSSDQARAQAMGEEAVVLEGVEQGDQSLSDPGGYSEHSLLLSFSEDSLAVQRKWPFLTLQVQESSLAVLFLQPLRFLSETWDLLRFLG